MGGCVLCGAVDTSSMKCTMGGTNVVGWRESCMCVLGGCSGLNCVLSKCVITSITWVCDLTGRQSLYRSSLVNMRSLNLAIIQQQLSLYKGGIWTQTHMRAHTHTQGEDEGSGWVMLLQATEHPRLLTNHQETGQRMEQILSLSLRRELILLTPWSWTFSLQNCDRINFCCWSYPVYGTLL